MLPETARPSRSRPLAARASLALSCGAFALSACAALNVQTYSAAKQPADQVARMRPVSVQVLAVDAAPIKQQCGGRLMKDCNVLLLPGLHSMRIQLMSLDGRDGPGYVAPTVATPGLYVPSSSYYLPVGKPVTVRYTILAGHNYSMVLARICFTNPHATNPQERAEPAKAGVCLLDETAGRAVHAE